jgi:RNA polymerase sigma-70 factor (ECF subfamily)
MTHYEVTDEQLMTQFQAGVEEAYNELVGRYRNPLYNYICWIINDRAYAEDLLQETFIRLWTNKQSYREIAKFSTWIYTIAGNLAKTELRRRKIRRWLPISGGGGEDDRPMEFADETADPDRDLERRTIEKRVNSEIQKLPSAFREAVILRDIQELTYEEISTILKVPLGTVKSRVNRGRARLQKRLGDLR